jgi:hypothetical protein
MEMKNYQLRFPLAMLTLGEGGKNKDKLQLSSTNSRPTAHCS